MAEYSWHGGGNQDSGLQLAWWRKSRWLITAGMVGEIMMADYSWLGGGNHDGGLQLAW